MHIELVELQKGLKCRIMALGCDSRFPLLDFIDQCNRTHEKKLRQLQALFDRFADTGEIRNTEKVRMLEDGLFEFKAGGILRVTWFWDRNYVVICGHCFVKKSNQTPKNDLKQARRWKKIYEEARR